MTTSSGAVPSRRLTWLGHSTVLIELDGTNVLTDPVLGRRVAHLLRPRSSVPAPLPALDLVLVSHVHFDHLDLRSLDRLDHGVPLVVPRGAGDLLKRRKFADVREVAEGEEVALNGLRVRVTHAEHEAKRGPLGVEAPALGYVVEGSRAVYFAGDTDLFDGMATLAKSLDVALLPVAGWGARTPPGHLDVERAAQAVKLLEPKLAVPIHWGTFRPFFRRAPQANREAGEAFAARTRQVAPNVDVRVLRPGEGCPI